MAVDYFPSKTYSFRGSPLAAFDCWWARFLVFIPFLAYLLLFIFLKSKSSSPWKARALFADQNLLSQPHRHKHRVSRLRVFSPVSLHALGLFHLPTTWSWSWHDNAYHEHWSFLAKLPLNISSGCTHQLLLSDITRFMNRPSLSSGDPANLWVNCSPVFGHNRGNFALQLPVLSLGNRQARRHRRFSSTIFGKQFVAGGILNWVGFIPMSRWLKHPFHDVSENCQVFLR